ncbi:hypothetical protein Q8A73_012473 [Channa argus]|nr:hypothetical protein Q8A73_012473 [Channa argus]
MFSVHINDPKKFGHGGGGGGVSVLARPRQNVPTALPTGGGVDTCGVEPSGISRGRQSEGTAAGEVGLSSFSVNSEPVLHLDQGSGLMER